MQKTITNFTCSKILYKIQILFYIYKNTTTWESGTRFGYKWGDKKTY